MAVSTSLPEVPFEFAVGAHDVRGRPLVGHAICVVHDKRLYLINSRS